MTQLLESTDVWKRLVDDGMPVDVVCLDFAKAFDPVPHNRLLIKLNSYGIQGNIFSWIKGFLVRTNQRVVLNCIPFSWAPVTSGIPQGSVLGSLSFISMSMIYLK